MKDNENYLCLILELIIKEIINKFNKKKKTFVFMYKNFNRTHTIINLINN